MNAWLAMLLTVLIGALLPLQGLVNARLGAGLGGPIVAAFVSFSIGTLLLGGYLALTRTAIAAAEGARLPAWIWAGGLFGAVYVACFTLLVPRLGAASMICLAVLGQVTASLLLDHFGVLQAPRPADPLRLLGGALVVVGVLLVAAPWRTPVDKPDAPPASRTPH